MIPFPPFHFQALWIAAVLQGSLTLQSIDAIEDAMTTQEDYLKRAGLYEGKYRYMGVEPFEYMKTLVKEAGLKYAAHQMRYIDMLQGIYSHVSEHGPRYVGAPDTYRNTRYIVDR